MLARIISDKNKTNNNNMLKKYVNNFHIIYLSSKSIYIYLAVNNEGSLYLYAYYS